MRESWFESDLPLKNYQTKTIFFFLASKSLNSKSCYNKVLNFTEKVLFCSTYGFNKLNNGTSFKFKDNHTKDVFLFI